MQSSRGGSGPSQDAASLQDAGLPPSRLRCAAYILGRAQFNVRVVQVNISVCEGHVSQIVPSVMLRVSRPCVGHARTTSHPPVESTSTPPRSKRGAPWDAAADKPTSPARTAGSPPNPRHSAGVAAQSLLPCYSASTAPLLINCMSCSLILCERRQALGVESANMLISVNRAPGLCPPAHPVMVLHTMDSLMPSSFISSCCGFTASNTLPVIVDLSTVSSCNPPRGAPASLPAVRWNWPSILAQVRRGGGCRQCWAT